ncbi:TonB-dependent receptor [Rubrivirga litoralis]|uniref:TonB-dependent receptor n=1 Tax=Rubrivirga litoralis TaxID=3075598 RepID=A0ABU3BN19_9BACT|nr:TonB-dependent receptor [Rubrivirga sp. F394]MDT0630684.1 TonB-dependent receptor [Rubrivirga sp. F394]
MSSTASPSSPSCAPRPRRRRSRGASRRAAPRSRSRPSASSAGGAAADADGRFRLRLPGPGTFTVSVSAVGYAPVQRRVTAGAGETIRLDVDLDAATYEAGAVVVTGTLEQMAVRDSPVKVEVVPARFLETTPSANVMDAVERVNGLYQQIDCGVCYTNNIRINGIDGPNTAVLIDGMPVMSSLATVYGLNGISPMLIKQVEVVKGPMSTLYGSEALGGVINIITKDPSTAPRLSTNVFSTTHAEMAAEFAAVPLRGRTSALVSGTLFHVADYHDNNGDGFSDRPFETRLALFGKATRQDTQGFERASLVAKAYVEDRAAGFEPFLDDVGGLRGSDRVYGESIYTRRAELIGTWTPRPDLTVRASGALHDQDSYYGDVPYAATQADGFGQVVWTPPTEGTALDGHNLLAGAALRAIRYDDGSAATGVYDDAGALVENRPDTRVVPGVFVQDDWRVNERLPLLGGLRADVQPGYGVIPSPRAAVKWRPAEATTARLNVGTGFRVVNLFTEDHAAYTGGRATLILEDLEPERSVSVTGSLQQILGATSPVTVDIDAF